MVILITRIGALERRKVIVFLLLMLVMISHNLVQECGKALCHYLLCPISLSMLIAKISCA